MKTKCPPKISFIVFLLFLSFGRASAQGVSSFNLNVDNGLPSNHVYGMITDRFGYLWICTDRGVARYNGYECKIFTVADGLPSNDVWELLEDAKGRIWLGCMSDEIGYLYNDKFFKTEIDGFKGTVFPSGMVKYRDGIVFGSQYMKSSVSPSLCIAKNDTIFSVVLDDSLFRNFKDVYNVSTVWPSVNGRVYAYHKQRVYEIASIDSIATRGSKLQPKYLFGFNEYKTMTSLSALVSIVVGSYIIFYKPGEKSGKIIRFNTNTGLLDTIHVKNDGVSDAVNFVNYNKTDYDSVLYVYTKDYVRFYKLVDTPKLIYRHRTTGMSGIEGKAEGVVAYVENDLWDTCIGTNSSGVFLNNSIPGHFKKVNVDLSGFQFVGLVHDSLTYWWSQNKRKLLEVLNGTLYRTINIGDVRGINRVQEYNRDSLLLFAAGAHYYSRKKDVSFRLGQGVYGSSVTRIVPDFSGNYFVLAKSGIYRARHDGYVPIKFSYQYVRRYEDLISDPVRRKTWAFNTGEIMVFDTSCERILSKKQIRDIGAVYVKGLCVDSVYGNAFIIGASSLVMYDYESGKGTALLENINLAGGQMSLYRDMLVVVSGFGVICYKIIGKNKVSAPQYCNNIKQLYYKQVSQIAVTNRKILIVSDGGTYTLENSYFDKDLENESMASHNYRLLAAFNGKTERIIGEDTLRVNQENRKVLFDVIKPYGSGKLKFFYKGIDDSSFQELNSNELNLPNSYKPDNYYHVQLYVGDNGWKSDVYNFTVYINPYWWQTNTAIRLIWIASILLGIGIVSVAIFVTRKIVLKSAERKQLNMEMELKSIYAQINPHFIFNTLGSAMLLASNNKMEEVYTHISKFSRLLRSYLRSSRNKYITVGEEAENLRNYIELQQTRFKNRFGFELNISARIDEMGMKIPSLLIQPFVENAINHGILEKQDGVGCLNISFDFAEKEKKIICVIDDNGIGRNESRLRKLRTKEGRESYGDLMIKDLVDIFNRYEGIEIDITYIDKEAPESGTTVIISIWSIVK